MVAIVPLADAAGDADGLKPALQVEPVGIDEACGMGDLAA